MEKTNKTPELTAAQQKALEAGHGLVQGDSYVLMRNDVVLDWFGYTHEQLRDELQPALDQADRGELVDWNLQGFLAEMRQGQESKSE